MRFVWAATIHILKRGVVARSAFYMTSGCGASVSLSQVGKGVLSAYGWPGVFVTEVTKGVAVGALGVGDERQVTRSSIC